MEDYRTESLETIKARIVRDKALLELKQFEWNSNSPISKTNIPAIYMFEGRDVIEKHNQRNVLGYPARRHLEINIEVITKNDRNASGVKNFLKLVKRTIFCDREGDGENIIWTPNPVVAKDSFIQELRSKGPGTYDVPELVGMKMVVGLWYTDNGFL